MADSFFSGAIMMACFTNAGFFYRYWKLRHDRLFFWFAISFAMMGLERFINMSVAGHDEGIPEVYLIRLVAFVLIVFGIWSKNRSGRHLQIVRSDDHPDDEAEALRS